MTINVALVTNEAIIFGCDSIASATTPMIRPFDNPAATDEGGNTLTDADGNALIPLIDVQQVVTDVFSGVTKMFQIYDRNNTVVAATTAGMATLNDRPIASLVSDYFMQQKDRQKPYANVSAVANSFLKFIRKEYEKDQNASGFPEKYWSDLDFLVGGYGKHDNFPSLYRIKVKPNTSEEVFSNGATGVAWAGQADTLERLFRGYDSNLKNHVEKHIEELMDEHHDNMSQAMVTILTETLRALGADMPEGVDTVLPQKPQKDLGWEEFHVGIDYANLPLQDAIDFASFLAFTQAGKQKFSRGFATVGGRIHVGYTRKGHDFEMLNEPNLTHRHTGFGNDL
jgi:hypothetical protein